MPAYYYAVMSGNPSMHPAPILKVGCFSVEKNLQHDDCVAIILHTMESTYNEGLEHCELAS